MPVLLSVLSYPVLVSSAEALVVCPMTEAVQTETSRDGSTQAAEAVLTRKDLGVDLSNLALPVSHGPFELGAFHVFPAQEPGPYLGPPPKIWGLGFGTSLWRNPVAGWP
ncbi:MAG TPA: hypothetical protein VGC53_07605, partial [Vicinamibacteria bacterium]